MISLDDPVQVTQALAGGEETCYKVTLTRGGQAVTGYVLGDALPAVAAFLKTFPKPTDADIDAGITNICRCGTYEALRRAIHRAADMTKA